MGIDNSKYPTHRSIKKTKGLNNKSVSVSNFRPQKYSQKNVTFSDMPLFFPDQNPHVFLIFYFLTLPYFVGTVFLFFYAAKADFDLFFELDILNNYLLTWAVGYEFLATVSLLLIFKNAISYSLKTSRQQGQYKKLSKLEQQKRKYKEYL